jgi:hypothetical protein
MECIGGMSTGQPVTLRLFANDRQLGGDFFDAEGLAIGSAGLALTTGEGEFTARFDNFAVSRL